MVINFVDKTMERTYKTEEKTSSSDKKVNKSGAHRKNAVAACQIDLSCLNVPLEKDGLDGVPLKRSLSERRKKTDRQGSAESADTNERPYTEKLRRKFKSFSNKADLDTLGACGGIDKAYDEEKTKTCNVRSRSVSNLKEEVIVAVDFVRKISRSDNEILIQNEVDIRKQTTIPNKDLEWDNMVRRTHERRSKSEVVNPLEVFLTREETEGVKKKVNTIQIKSSSEDLIDKIMQDMYKETDLELLSLELFDSLLNIDKVEFQRSSSFGVANDYKHERQRQWYTKPVFKHSVSIEDKQSDEGADYLDENQEMKRDIVKQKKRVSQHRAVNDRSDKQSDQRRRKEDKRETSKRRRGYDGLRRKSRSQEQLRGINEEFLRVLHDSTIQRYHQDDEGFSGGSSAEDILTGYAKDKIQKARRKIFAENSMDSIDEYAESPPLSPRMGKDKHVFAPPAQAKTEKKRKISTGKKIIEKIKTEISRKISGGEKAPNGEKWHDKIKREKSFERLRNKKREIDKKFQKWIDFVVCLHVSRLPSCV